MLVQRVVPGHLDESTERDGRTTGFNRPRPHRVQQILPDPAPLVVRHDADLLNVGISTHDIDDDVANRPIGFIDSNPTAPTKGIGIQHLHRHGFGVSYRFHSDRPERISGQCLDLSQDRTLCGEGATDMDHLPHILPRRRPGTVGSKGPIVPAVSYAGIGSRSHAKVECPPTFARRPRPPTFAVDARLWSRTTESTVLGSPCWSSLASSRCGCSLSDAAGISDGAQLPRVRSPAALLQVKDLMPPARGREHSHSRGFLPVG
jgi:hypothetical protein